MKTQKHPGRGVSPAALATGALLLSACGPADGVGGGTAGGGSGAGGAPVTGGMSGSSGGATQVTGGMSGGSDGATLGTSGANPVTGGATVGSGGGPGSSGTSGSDGMTAGTGGSAGSAGAGGTPGSGGASAGTGGSVGGSGGSVGTGGASGTGGSGGSAGVGGTSTPTGGCSIANWPPANDQSGSTPHTLDISGTTREFLVSLPTDYSADQQRKVIFVWHPQGGTHRGTVSSGYHGVRSLIPEAIYVAAQGLDSGGSTGWPNTNGGDIAFTREMLSWLQENYCLDTTRIFSTGFSYGGIMSDTIACQMPEAFRAIAPIAGMLFSGTQSCEQLPIAALFIHGVEDTINPISGNVTVRDYLLGTNHCATTTTPVEPSPCVAYAGCDAGKPVIWCEHAGGHTIPSFSAPAISAFFQQF